ncbi:MaoC/PaaZ C-terminal domain-containing protein [Enterovirga rhinocerotis]|uniref:Acyl dehydratase n=1 Tax=Enterovirga rhinocerotis TaxID=1339210 RepID=A0A4R7BXP5_9HYPH|nr:MaoC/PaaZ C-terminal domain-containing protein [Enterovirga rhinocerotis]TDR90002.1 acyl dehydratase [Enterovirga rhinocerotis]
MAIDRDTLLAWEFPEVVQSFDHRDSILYALGLGIGSDPLDRAQLRFVYEDGLRALPTMGVILGYPGFWLSDPRTGADWKRLLHGEQDIEIVKPLPAQGRVVGRTRVVDVIDKGAGKGALVLSERTLHDKDSGDLFCRMASTTFLRGDGGFGGPSGPTKAPHPIPDRKPDLEVATPTLPQAALIYRLSGDWNPLHADPDVAKAGGFDRPILHGLCTFGIAGYAVLTGAADGDPDRLASLAVRFSAPVMPGETIVTEIWHEDDGVLAFRSRVRERGLVVLNNGRAALR